MKSTLLFAIAAGGALGALGRHWVSGAALRVMGPGFPWGTLTVNVVGSFVMGVFIAVLAAHATSQALRAFLTVGLLGAFTTFSTFSLDIVFLAERKEFGAALTYGAASVTLSIGALLAGLALARSLS